MDQRIKCEWVALLRSGGVEQANGNLYDEFEKSFCCLGVLCEMARTEGIVDINSYGSYYALKNDLDSNNTELPIAVQEWAGLDSKDPMLKWQRDSLAGLNDGGKTFKQIADIIEKGL